MSFDRSLLAHEAREKYLSKQRGKSEIGNHLVSVRGKDGAVFSATVELCLLGENGITAGRHAGLLWWPAEY